MKITIDLSEKEMSALVRAAYAAKYPITADKLKIAWVEALTHPDALKATQFDPETGEVK